MRKLEQSITKSSETRLNIIQNLDRQTVEISVLSSDDVSKYEFLTRLPKMTCYKKLLQ